MFNLVQNFGGKIVKAIKFTRLATALSSMSLCAFHIAERLYNLQ